MIRCLNVEVGGSYGGSLRALEMHLAFSDRSQFTHDMLFYYPTPGAERLRDLVDDITVLYPKAPRWLTTTSARESNMLRRWMGWGRLSIASLQSTCSLLRFIRAKKYDLVHVNNTFTYQAPTIIAARLSGVPVVAHVRNPVRQTRVSRMLLRSVAAIATVSRNYERILAEWGGSVVVRTCYDGITTPVTNATAATQLRKDLLAEGTFLIGTAGRLDRQKAYHHLIEAARMVCLARPGARFAIAGDGPLRLELDALIRRFQLADHVILCGFRPDVGTFLCALDLFVCSSLWEGLPIAVVEAMLLGKPVVATDVGGMSEIVRSTEGGSLVPPGDPEALAAAVLEAMDRAHSLVSTASLRVEHAAAMADPRLNAHRLDHLMAISASMAEPTPRTS
jgi:glycosyltransferase involved in cell wall biosynthesis